MKGLLKMPIGIGVSSLMMMFIGLTMASIMGLSLMTSYRDYQLTQKEVESTKAYYEAEAKANRVLLEIEETYEVYQTAIISREDLLEKALEEIEEIKEVKLEDDLKVTYQIQVINGQNLQIVLKLPIKKTDNSKKTEYIENEEKGDFRFEEENNSIEEKNIKIVSWQIVQESPWEYEEEGFGETMLS